MLDPYLTGLVKEHLENLLKKYVIDGIGASKTLKKYTTVQGLQRVGPLSTTLIIINQRNNLFYKMILY